MDKIKRKCFKGDYYKDICDGIKNKFKPIYNTDIIIKYTSDKGFYYFKVYIKGTTFSSSGEEIGTDIHIDNFDNIDAINIFATKYTLNDFNSEYNDYSEDNHKILKEEIVKLVKEYEAAGMIFKDVEIYEYGYRVSVYHPLYSEKYSSGFSNNRNWKVHVTGHNFSVTPISTSTMKSAIRDVKSMLNKFNASCIQAAITGEKI